MHARWKALFRQRNRLRIGWYNKEEMIRHTFSILNGIGQKLEKRLWREGILTWSDFINSPDVKCIPGQKKTVFDESLVPALQALENENAAFFSSSLNRTEHWRLYVVCKGEAVCLDIETNGLMPESGGYTTLIGMFDGHDYRCLVQGIDLNAENFMNALAGYKYLITFYGSVFDIPFLTRSLNLLDVRIPHFDICFGARRVGFRGGLKKLETEMGIQRTASVKGLNGYDAVKLWTYAKNGSREALQRLQLYNKEDTVNLFTIADRIYRRLRSRTGIEEYL
jgi:uncharacterized protein YprB with RNaseH-like and TPR domain